MPAGWENIGQHHVVILPVGSVLGELQAIEVAVRHAQVLRLTALQLAHARIAVACTCITGVERQASRSQATLAVLAISAGGVERDADIVAAFEDRYGRATLEDLAQIFVTDDLARLEIGAALVHVQVGPADVGCRDFPDDVARVLDARIGHFLDLDVTRAVIDDGFHEGFAGQARVCFREQTMCHVKLPQHARHRQGCAAACIGGSAPSGRQP